tara:strand:+ start:1275 stop:2111 length:837 start_codon:yes stop_codon:yes gene_type:complete
VIPVCSVVTQKTLSEFRLLKFSLEQYHDVEWFISCDDVVDEFYKDVEEVNLLKVIETDDCDHNIQSEEKNDNWMKVMMSKFSVCMEALKKRDYCLFLDSDMVFVNPIENRVLDLLESKTVDAIISPHMTNNVSIEAKHGYYNAGMFASTNTEFLQAWEGLSKDYKKYNMYFEQQPLEFSHRHFLTANFPMHYNLGWWRFNLPQTQGRIKMFNEKDGVLYFANNRAVNFHFHALRELETDNFGKFMVDFIFDYLSKSSNEKYVDLYKKYEELKNENNIG